MKMSSPGLVKLEELTWKEVETYLQRSNGILIPCGSIEQHGPIGLIGTDVICAREIAWNAAQRVDGLVAPEIGYSPAPFNMSFPGTVSLSIETYEALMREIIEGLISHGFRKIYLINGHGANLDPLRKLASEISSGEIRLKSWWEFDAVNHLRNKYFGDWEGMHGTPSEVSITQATHREINAEGLLPPRQLTSEYMKAHAGDRHGPPDEHRRDFPDGRVGSKSELATPEYGLALLDAAGQALAEDYLAFLKQDKLKQ
jgi:creatinine amidohydrolase